MFGLIVAAASGAFTKSNEQKSIQNTALNSSSKASSKNTNIQVVNIENTPSREDKSKTQERLAEQLCKQLEPEMEPRVRLNYATYVLSVIFGICLLLQLFAALFFASKALLKDKKRRKKIKKQEKSLFRQWLADQEKKERQDVEKGEKQESKQKSPEDAAHQTTISQKQELDQIRMQATKLLKAINDIPVEVQMNPNAASQ